MTASFDLVIIGGGPAALSAALYAGRAGIAAQIYESQAVGGTLNQIPRLENYPGFQGSGASLTKIMKSQAVQAGASLAYGECTALRYTAEPVAPGAGTSSPTALVPDALVPRPAFDASETTPVPAAPFELIIDGEPVLARTVIIATGSVPRRLDFELNIPVSYCALCDGALAAGKRTVVVGGANSAAQEALYLANLANNSTQVTLISHSALKADAELQKRLRTQPNVEIIENTEPTAAMLNQYDYCFVNIGRTPATQFLRELDLRISQKNQPPHQLLDSAGYLLATGLQTVVPGLFAAGDVRAGAVRQIVTACADGAQAALLAADFLRQIIN